MQQMEILIIRRKTRVYPPGVPGIGVKSGKEAQI
jgi:hypothetical protein